MIRPVVSAPARAKGRGFAVLAGTGVTSEKWTSPAVLKVQDRLREESLVFWISRWGVPFKSGETSIIPVRGHPVAAGLHGQCREPRVGYQVTASVSVFAEADKYGPVLRSRR
jgi:hypothetical protein